MNLRDQMQLDAEMTFLNPLEFAEPHTIDGRELLITIDDDKLQERKSRSSNPTDGVYGATLLFYARAADFSTKPVPEMRMTIDGKIYTIADVQSDAAMITVTLRRFRS